MKNEVYLENRYESKIRDSDNRSSKIRNRVSRISSDYVDNSEVPLPPVIKIENYNTLKVINFNSSRLS